MSHATIEQLAPAGGTRSGKILDDRIRARRISAVIRHADRRLRRRFGILNHQDLIGSMIFLLAACSFVASSAAYLYGLIPGWACILINAFAASILHELEHDLIHNLYFRKNLWIQNSMMFAVWAFRGNIINPWHRRKLHLLHHKESGQHTDLEEQLIGNGMRYGWRRWLTTFDGFIGTIVRGPELIAIPAYNTLEMVLASLPFIPLFAAGMYSWIALHGAELVAWTLGTSIAWPAWVNALIPVLDAAFVIYIAPNLIRQASINIISSSMHYFGDVETITEQTQVLNRWYFWPLQAFCFNFGSTHGIHHFVVNQPFYLRQMVAGPAHAAMKRYGVRFNDLGTFRRANRLHAAPQARA